MASPAFTIRPLAADNLPEIFRLDVSRAQTAQYVVSVSTEPCGLFLERQELAVPRRSPTWGHNECRTRLELWQRNLAEGAHFLGCYAGQPLVGFALISPLLTDGMIELFSIFVDAAQRRRGIGTLLLRKAEEEAAARSAKVLHLTTTLDNASAIDFYLHHSYRLAQLTDRATVPNQDPEIRLAKTLCTRPTD